jgi:hypothetical protein
MAYQATIRFALATCFTASGVAGCCADLPSDASKKSSESVRLVLGSVRFALESKQADVA